MKRILAFNGTPRPAGNTGHLLRAFSEGAGEHGASPEVILAHGLHLKACTGCLRCNVLQRCSLSGDDWDMLRDKILDSDVLVFASPIYFHHLPSTLKAVLDRFRSFANVQVTEKGLIHTPYREWHKEFVLILSQGSPDPSDSRPVIDLFRYICRIMGPANNLHVVTATGLSMVNQVTKTARELAEQYRKMKLPERLVAKDVRKNREMLDQCRELGRTLSLPG
jgi:NAD(P)H-dependent FMN reductase